MHSRTGTRTCCKAKAKDLSFKAKAKAKDMKIVLKDSLRTRPRPRTNITECKYRSIKSCVKIMGQLIIEEAMMLIMVALCNRADHYIFAL